MTLARVGSPFRQPGADPRPELSRGNRGTPLVLIVDDDDLLRLPAVAALRRGGFATIEASDGKEGLELFSERMPDIVLLDVEMPRMNGYELCSVIRESHRGRHLPILMLTGLDDLDSIRAAYAHGATDFAVKPINWLILSHRVEYMLRSSRATQELRESRHKLETAQRIAGLGYWEWDVALDRVNWSPMTDQLAELRGRDERHGFSGLLERMVKEDRERAQRFFYELSRGRPVDDLEVRIQSREGLRFLHFDAEISPRQAAASTLVSGTIQDVTERHRAEERIRVLANYDAVTGLPNRQTFCRDLEPTLDSASEAHRSSAVLLLDLDRFKQINDSLGHRAGDELLRQVAERLDSHAPSRTASPRPTLLARLGGDEFVALLPLTSLPEQTELPGQQAERAGRNLLATLEHPFTVLGHELKLTASLGIALAPKDGCDAETLITRADAAMCHAKRELRGSLALYDESMSSASLDRLLIENELAGALDRGELEVFYQPQFDSCRRMVGAEALLRWRHATRGLVSPADFIPIAEETGLIVEIGDWVLNEACLQAARWQRKGFDSFRIGVNLSVRQLRPELVEIVTLALKRSGLAPRHLALELTESILMPSADKNVELLLRLQALGVGLCIDDFGTGYSSLSYLSRFPLTFLKIDRSFVGRLPKDADNTALVRAILAMAKSLGLQVVAEGVETEDQLHHLTGAGCDELQGFLLGRPVPAEELERSFDDDKNQRLRLAASAAPRREG